MPRHIVRIGDANLRFVVRVARQQARCVGKTHRIASHRICVDGQRLLQWIFGAIDRLRIACADNIVFVGAVFGVGERKQRFLTSTRIRLSIAPGQPERFARLVGRHLVIGRFLLGARFLRSLALRFLAG